MHKINKLKEFRRSKVCNGKWAKRSFEKAKALGNHFANPHDDEGIAFIESPDQLDLPITPFTPTEVRGIVYKLHINKATGYDLIILKELPPSGDKYLTQLYNSIVRLSFVLR